MGKHLHVGSNYQSNTIEFSGQKVAKIIFDVAFETHPSVGITLEDSGSTHAPYRTKVKKTGFRVVLKNPYNGTIGWTAAGG